MKITKGLGILLGCIILLVLTMLVTQTVNASPAIIYVPDNNPSVQADKNLDVNNDYENNPTENGTALLPVGLEQAEVPDLTLDGFLYMAQSTAFSLALGGSYPPTQQLLDCFYPSTSNESLWIKGVFTSPLDALSAYNTVSASYNAWESYNGDDLYVIYPNDSTSDSLIEITNQGDFVSFKETYPEQWNLINKLPADPLEKVVGAGFIKPTDNLKNWLQNMIDDKESIGSIIDLIEIAKMESVAVGLYSQSDLSLVGKGALWDWGVSFLFVGDSSYSEFTLSLITPALSSMGMTEDSINGQRVYWMAFENGFLMYKNMGSYVYISAASSLAEARKLLGTVIGTTKSAPTPSPASYVRPIVNSKYTPNAPSIDGVFESGEWQGNPIYQTLHYVSNGTPETHEMTVYFMNDENYLYAGIKIANDDSASNTVENADEDVIELYFDNNNDGKIDENEDIYNFWNLKYSDWHYQGNGQWTVDQRQDGSGIATHSGQDENNYVYEFKIPLNSGDIQDLSVSPDKTLGVKILYREMHYDAAKNSYIWDAAEDGWPVNEGRFDVTTYGKLVLSGGKATVPAPAETPFKDSIPLPSELSVDPEVIGTNILLAIVTMLIFYFGATFFNSTIKEKTNYDTIQGWFRKVAKNWRFLSLSRFNSIGRYKDRKPVGRVYVQGLLIVSTCAMIYWFLDPYYTDGLNGIALYISLVFSIAIATISYDGMQLFSTRRYNVGADIRIFPIAVLIAFICLALSRAIHFRPGLIFGFVGAYTAATISNKQHGKAIFYSAMVILIISAAAFVLRELLHNSGWMEGNFWRYLVDNTLVATFAIGLEGLIFSLVPLDFFDGSKLKEWSWKWWLLLFGATTFAFYWIIINKDEKLVDVVKNTKIYLVFLLVILFAIAGFLTWAYFKWWHKTDLHTMEKTNTSELPEKVDASESAVEQISELSLKNGVTEGTEGKDLAFSDSSGVPQIATDQAPSSPEEERQKGM